MKYELGKDNYSHSSITHISLYIVPLLGDDNFHSSFKLKLDKDRSKWHLFVRVSCNIRLPPSYRTDKWRFNLLWQKVGIHKIHANHSTTPRQLILLFQWRAPQEDAFLCTAALSYVHKCSYFVKKMYNLNYALFLVKWFVYTLDKYSNTSPSRRDNIWCLKESRLEYNVRFSLLNPSFL